MASAQWNAIFAGHRKVGNASSDMHPYSDQFTEKPTTVDEFIRCVVWSGCDPGVAFDSGSTLLLSAKPALVRDAMTRPE